MLSTGKAKAETAGVVCQLLTLDQLRRGGEGGREEGRS